MISLASEIVYMQESYWCDCSARQLKLSFMHPRRYYAYDLSVKANPVLVFLCGGGFKQMDRNVWIPNLVYFAEHGYAVACVEYSVLPDTKHQDQLMEIKTALRFLRANAEELCIDPDRIAIMGESAGAYLAALAAFTGDSDDNPKHLYADQSDSVKACVTWYTSIFPLKQAAVPEGCCAKDFPDLRNLITSRTPPCLLMHGTEDEQVPCVQSELLYAALQKQAIPCDFYLIKDAHHADPLFVQTEIKQIVCDFLDRYVKQK